MTYVLAFDIGSGSIKTDLFRSEALELISSFIQEYKLIVEARTVENNPADWWEGMRKGVAGVCAASGVSAAEIEAVSFCAQMQGLVLLDEHGMALRNSINYLDSRATVQFEKHMRSGWPHVYGMNARKLLTSVWITNAAAGTPKDPLWKFHWVKDNEPELFRKTAKWVDVKDSLIARCTGKTCTTADSAHLTFLYDVRKGREGWSRTLCRMFDVDPALLPDVVTGSHIVGPLLEGPAKELGLAPGTPVVAGGGDVSCTALGAGCPEDGDLHMYIGTSAWVGQTTSKMLVDAAHFMASVCTPTPDFYLYLGELQTAGVCVNWAIEGLLGKGTNRAAGIEELNYLLDHSEPGAHGTLFGPWLQGSRSPNEDPYARGMFFNLQLQTERSDMVRAVFEGVGYHLNWILEAMHAKLPTQHALRLVGGGGRSRGWAQILADITGKTVEVPAHPQHVGTRGAAMLALVGLGKAPDLRSLAKNAVPFETYPPNAAHVAVYEKQYRLFKEMYQQNRKLFAKTASSTRRAL